MLIEQERVPFRTEQIVNKQTWDRIRKTMALIENHIVANRRALDYGPDSDMSKALRNYFHIKVTTTGERDLDDAEDLRSSFGTFDYVFAFEILEHLFNPLMVVQHAHEHLRKDGLLFVTIPSRPCWLRHIYHFHEMDDYRFRHLASRGGFEVVRHERFRMGRNGLKWIGFRPLIRYFCERVSFYELKRR